MKQLNNTIIAAAAHAFVQVNVLLYKRVSYLDVSEATVRKIRTGVTMKAQNLLKAVDSKPFRHTEYQ